MISCKTCKYWKKQYYDQGCMSDMCCEYDCWPRKEDPATAFRVEASAADDTSLSAVLITGPDFGCIHWKSDYE